MLIENIFKNIIKTEEHSNAKIRIDFTYLFIYSSRPLALHSTFHKKYIKSILVSLFIESIQCAKDKIYVNYVVLRTWTQCLIYNHISGNNIERLFSA